jgi:hypothetical protein
MSKPEDKILVALDNLVAQYEDELDFLHNRSMSKFDTSVLPQIMQDLIKVAVAKSPSFSNISATAVANFVLSHTFGQLRPVINDPIYSDDTIGINTYNIILSRSGSGKDSVYQAITKATHKAMEYIQNQQALEAEEVARAQYIKDMVKGNPEFDQSSVSKDDYADYVKKPEMAITNLASTRGGLTTSLNRMAKSNYGIKSLFASELGLAIQSNSSIVDVLELFSILYDMGQSVAPEFKTEDAKEESVNGMFPNLLGISSPAPFYTEGNVRKLLVPLLTTSLARRITVVFSNAAEEFENEYIPKSPSEKRQLQAEQRVVLKEYTEAINEKLLEAAKSLEEDSGIMFDEQASEIYDDYKSYTQELSKSLLLRNGDSVEGIEMSGRAFKMARIAATWTVASNKRIIDADTLKAAIYFCDYTAQHLTRFADTLELKDYELFINDWQQGFFDNVLPIDQAITKGYINVKHITNQALTNFLKPVNSKLEGVATVSYNEKSNAFIFVPAIRNLDATYTYRACVGHVTERPITNIAKDKPMDALGKLLSLQASFNPFAEDTTKFIAFTVNQSFLSMQMISKYLANIHHFISTTADVNNHHSFTVVLPINTVITKSEYKYVVMSVAAQLMLRVAPEFCEFDHISYGYQGALQITNNTPASLFDVSGILGNHASGSDIPLLAVKAAVKPTATVVNKYLNDDILAHKQTLIEMLDASSNPLLLFASVVFDMAVHGVDQVRILEIVDSINSSLEKSIPESVKLEYLIEPFTNL